MMDRRLTKQNTALLVIDVQEKLFPVVERAYEMTACIQKAVRGFQILGLPVFSSEQYPKGLGKTIPPLQSVFGEEHKPLEKTTFSCLGDEKVKSVLLNSGIQHWVLAGIEAHVCVLQTAADLLDAGMKVVVLNDAISSRSIFDYSTAIAEMRDWGARISSTETVLFELVKDSRAAEFKQISQLVQCKDCCCC